MMKDGVWGQQREKDGGEEPRPLITPPSLGNGAPRGRGTGKGLEQQWVPEGSLSPRGTTGPERLPKT